MIFCKYHLILWTKKGLAPWIWPITRDSLWLTPELHLRDSGWKGYQSLTTSSKSKLSAFLDHYWNSWMNCKYGLWGLGVDKLPGLCWALSFLVSKLPSDGCLGKTAPKPLFQFAFCLESQQARDGETREQDSGSCIALCDVVISILPGCSLEWSLVYELYHVTSFLSGVSLPWQFICHSFICPLSYLHAPISLPMQPRPFCSQ